MKPKVNPGRLDQAALAVLERLCARHVEAPLGVSVWPQLAPVARVGLKRLGVPRTPLSEPAMGLARVAVEAARTIYQRRLQRAP